jgi:hypothetical protein
MPQLGLRLKDDERARLTSFALDTIGRPDLSAAIRKALPHVFFEPAKTGRPLGYSPKTGKIERVNG